MNFRGFITGRWKDLRIAAAKYRLLLSSKPAQFDRSAWPRSLHDPTTFYLECFRCFHQQLPPEVKAHRRYFTRRKRGFGEEAFHTMWSLLFQEFQPGNFLEIGVYRGQVVSLVTLLARRAQRVCDVYGISPFSNAGDSVSRYLASVDYYADTLRNFDAFNLPHPHLLRAYSTDPQAQELIRSRSWDMVYIDGNHDYEVAKCDWQICSQAVRPGGLVVLDDSGLSSRYQPPIFATRGHPGPSQVAEEIPRHEFAEILQVGHNRVFQKIDPHASA
jgi:SAM-dependent methyltransferase